MELNNAKISIFINQHETIIELIDDDASTTFATVKLTNDQLAAALSRVAHTKCSIEVRGIDKIGKTMSHKYHEFCVEGLDYNRRNAKEVLSEKIKETLPDGWISDNYFGSQNTFFQKDGKMWCRTTIRKWD